MKVLGIGIPELFVIAIIVFVVIMIIYSKKAESSDTSAPTAPKTSPTITAEEFGQCCKLHEVGALSQEEFDAIRKRYLGL